MSEKSAAVQAGKPSKREKRRFLRRTIIFFVIAALAALLAILSRVQMASIEENAGYVAGFPNFVQQHQMYGNYFTVGIICTVVWLALAVLAVVSLISVKRESVTLTESGVSGVAGRHFAFVCLGTVDVSVDFSQIADASARKSRLTLKDKSGKKFVFAIEGADELARKIQEKEDI